MALSLAEAGADAVVAARSKPGLAETAHLIDALGRRTLVVPTDVGVYLGQAALAALLGSCSGGAGPLGYT